MTTVCVCSLQTLIGALKEVWRRKKEMTHRHCDVIGEAIAQLKLLTDDHMFLRRVIKKLFQKRVRTREQIEKIKPTMPELQYFR